MAKTRKELDQKQKAQEDLRETVSLKISVTDELQNLIRQQKNELQIAKNQNIAEKEDLKREFAEARREMDKEKERLMQKLWKT